MRYKELKITVKRVDSETVQAALIAAGFDSMQIDDSAVAADILDNPELYKYDYLSEEIVDLADRAADDVKITLYFADDEEGAAQMAEAKAMLDELDADLKYEAALTGDDSEWLYKWQEHFRPVKAGERIVVKPSWEEYEPADDELVIEMDPGMAFGSGLHGTTSMCIKALEKYIPLAGEKPHVLDVGTGTGILSIAAVLLGAGGCLGIDIDEEAVRVAAENVERNGLAGRISIAEGDLMAGVDYDADIIAANLMADLVIKLTPSAAKHLRPGGFYITSGILDIKEEAVTEAIRGAGFDILEVLKDGDWRAVAAVKK